MNSDIMWGWMTTRCRTNRMLKKSASFVLVSSKSSTYPRGYASGFDSPAASLDGLFEHPPGHFSCHSMRTDVEPCAYHDRFPKHPKTLPESRPSAYSRRRA